MKLKAALLVAIVSAGFFLVDSKFHILFFKEKPEINETVKCGVKNLLEDLDGELEANDGQGISITLDKLVFQLNAAYGFETKFSILGEDSKNKTISELAKNIREARLKFDEFAKMSADEVLSNLGEIQDSRNAAKDLLVDLC